MMTGSITVEGIIGDIIPQIDFHWVLIMTLIILIGMDGIV